MKSLSVVQLAVVGVAISALVLSGCASTVQINSEPPGASVEINGQYIGETPTSYTDTAISQTSHRIVLEKPGYERTSTLLRRNGPINSGALVAGIFGISGCPPLLPAWLWLNDYPRSVNYRLRQAEEDEEVFADRRIDTEDGVTIVLVPEDETTTGW